MARLARRAAPRAGAARRHPPLRRLAARRGRRRRAVRDGRLVARARGAAAQLRRRLVPRPRHDASAARSARSRRSSTSSGRSSSPPRSRGRRSRRGRTPTTSGRRPASARAHVRARSPTRAPSSSASRASAASGAVFAGEPSIGGRYSALSPFGIVPGRADGRRRGAPPRARAGDARGVPLRRGQPRLRARQPRSARAGSDGRDKICIADAPGDFGLWAEQLIAESTGKHGKGLIPAPGESPDGADRQAAQPELPDPYALGAEFFRWEFAIAVAGAYLEINPFDQPDVQAAKDKTNEVLATGQGARARAGGLDRGAARAGAGGRLRLRPGVRRADAGPTSTPTRRPAAPRERLRRHARLRPALPPLDRPAPQGRPEHRPLPPGVDDEGDELPIPGKPFGFRRLHPRAGRGRPRVAEGARPPRRARPDWRTSDAARDGRPRPDGREHDRAPRARPVTTSRRTTRTSSRHGELARGARAAARRAALRLADGAGGDRRLDRSASSRRTSPRATRSSTAATRTTSTTSAAQAELQRQEDPLRRRRRQRRRLGHASAATA